MSGTSAPPWPALVAEWWWPWLGGIDKPPSPGSARWPGTAPLWERGRGRDGRCSRHGGIPLAWSLDTLGPMTRRMADVAVLLQIMAGADPADPTSLEAAVPSYPTEPPAGLAGTRIGIPDRFFWDGIDADIDRVCREALARLAALGAELVDVPAPPSTEDVLGRDGHTLYGATTVYRGPPTTAYELTVLVEATSYHRRLARERRHLYSPEVLGAVEAGETVSGADYLDAQRLRATWSREWREAFAAHRLDAVASPVIPDPVPLQTPSQSLFLGASFNLTKPWNLNGFPALSVPAGLDGRGLPVGLQLAALPLAEPALLSLAIALDEEVRFFTRKPPLVEAAG